MQPAWMAPEIISGKQYDAKADIWSFGITAIELCQGRAPRSRDTPAKVLLRTVQDEPPSFSREGGQYKYSKAFKEMVESCLAKDPATRPSAAELLDTPFLRSAKKKSYLVGAILKNLPPLTKRQERRKQNSVRNSSSDVPSWDFSSNPVSIIPGSSNYTILSPIRSAAPPQDVAEPDSSETSDSPAQMERGSSPESSIVESSSTPSTPDIELKSLPMVSTSYASSLEAPPLKVARPAVQTASSSGSSSSGSSNVVTTNKPPSAFRHHHHRPHPQHNHHHSKSSHLPQPSELSSAQSSMFAPLSHIISAGSPSGGSSNGPKTGVWKKLTKGSQRRRTQDEG